VLSDLKDELHVVANNLQGVKNGRERFLRELNVDDGTDDLHDGTVLLRSLSRSGSRARSRGLGLLWLGLRGSSIAASAFPTANRNCRGKRLGSEETRHACA